MKSWKALAILTVCLGLFLSFFKLKINLLFAFMLMHLVNNWLEKELQEVRGLELTTKRGMQWILVVLFCPKIFFFLVNVKSLWSLKQIRRPKVTINSLCQELNVPWILWDCLDVWNETYEDALQVHTYVFSSISSLVFLFFLRFGWDSYLLLLLMSLNHFFLLPFLLPSSFQLPLVPKKKSFLSLSFCSAVSLFCCLQGDLLPSHAWTVILCLEMCQKLSSLGHGVCHPCHLYLLRKVPQMFTALWV